VTVMVDEQEEQDVQPFVPSLRERSVGMALVLFEHRPSDVDNLLAAAEKIRKYIDDSKLGEVA
jgi:hypothetical protein